MKDSFSDFNAHGTGGQHPAADNAAESLAPDLLAAIRRYEQALMGNNTAVLSDLFANDPDGIPSVRSDDKGVLAGHTAISTFRSRRRNAPTRTLRRRIARQMDESTACVVSQFDKATGGSVIQTQVWQRIGESGTWKIVMAHLTYPTPAIDRSIWRVVGSPLVEATKPGPLSGMTVAVKDLYAVQGQRIGAGNPAFLRTSPVCAESAPAVRLLLNAGAQITGIAQTDEFAYSLAGTNVHYGTPPNPKAPGHVSGGSSSGPASAVACGQVDIGLGTDTAGSIRIPASYQGLWGIRTTHGRISCEAVHPLSQSFDTVGWMTRDAQTLEFAGKALMPDKDTVKSVAKLLVSPKLDECVTADVREAFSRFRAVSRSAVRSGRIGMLGDCDEVQFDSQMLDNLLSIFQAVRGYEAWRNNGDWVGGHYADLAPEIAARFECDSHIPQSRYEQGLEHLRQARSMVRNLLGSNVLLIPSASSTAPAVAHTGDTEGIENARAHTLRLTSIAGVAGLPAVNIPLETADGLPCGACLLGPAGSDKLLIRIAKELYRNSM
ncbi:AtzH-like domain-containing protein [Bifidobacterium moukalabense]|uniref:AtzH-like domain-containing protein n=1 Tax=Bifidobacterium moukalabense TaxID=1333651 RepID=UPI0010F6F79C|nr:AtzH-like domain-containing protein [Bifidobacterium moukalabense]